MIYFTADLHLFHKNIIDFCKRPFGDVQHMNFMLVNNWNKTVNEDDEVYILGDLSFGSNEKTLELVKQFHGKKYLVRGNHDWKLSREVLDHFEWAKDYHELSFEGRKVVLSHYAMRVWNQSHWGAWQLHGHSHGSLQDIGGLQLDVGVDCHNYAPVSIVEIGKIMAGRTKRHEDHHHIIQDHVCLVVQRGLFVAPLRM